MGPELIQNPINSDDSFDHYIRYLTSIYDTKQNLGQISNREHLYYFEGKSYREIAQLLQIDPESVRKQKFRALRQLRKVMGRGGVSDSEGFIVLSILKGRRI